MVDKFGAKFKAKLKKKGQSLKWFHGEYFERFKRNKLSYHAVSKQVNGYTGLSKIVKQKMEKYMGEK